MEKGQFDCYQFTIETEVKYNNKWFRIWAVDFNARRVQLNGTDCIWTCYQDIEDIQQGDISGMVHENGSTKLCGKKYCKCNQ